MYTNSAFGQSGNAIDGNAMWNFYPTERVEALPSADKLEATALSSDSSVQTEYSVSGLTGWQQNKVVRYIDDNIDTSLRVRDIAMQVRLSVSRFSKGFKVSFGRSPYDYVLSQRMETAKYLIASTNEPLSQIAHACGLSDQAHLSKVFKRLVGTTPLKWRRGASAAVKNTTRAAPLVHLPSLLGA